MNISTNFSQFLCREISENGENISGIFDTFVCNKGKNTFYICILYSQISRAAFETSTYYYRIVLRHLESGKEKKHFRLSCGFLCDFEDEKDDSKSRVGSQKCLWPGLGKMLFIKNTFDFEEQGKYQVDLYARKTDEEHEQDKAYYDKQPVKDMELVATSPFEAIFKTKE